LRWFPACNSHCFVRGPLLPTSNGVPAPFDSPATGSYCSTVGCAMADSVGSILVPVTTHLSSASRLRLGEEYAHAHWSKVAWAEAQSLLILGGSNDRIRQWEADRVMPSALRSQGHYSFHLSHSLLVGRLAAPLPRR
jgi:hypothetical protein